MEFSKLITFGWMVPRMLTSVPFHLTTGWVKKFATKNIKFWFEI